MEIIDKIRPINPRVFFSESISRGEKDVVFLTPGKIVLTALPSLCCVIESNLIDSYVLAK